MPMRTITVLRRAMAAVILAFAGRAAVCQAPAHSATVAMTVSNNRVFVPLRVTGPTGQSRVVQFWIDSGGDTLTLSGRLARELGLKPVGRSFLGMGEQRFLTIATPGLAIEGMPIDLANVGVAASSDLHSKRLFAGIEGEGFLPAKVLKKYDVVFDYPRGSFTLAQAGTLTHRGSPVAFSVQATTGFGRVELAIDGKTYGFMLDTGAAFTGMSRTLMDRLAEQHPAWRRSLGAVGSANMVGKRFDVDNELLLMPGVTWGPFHLDHVAAVTRPAGVYEKYVSADMSAPIVGALAGNVLRQFRVDLDYGHGAAYLEFHPEQGNGGLDCVGLIVQMMPNGSVLVSGVAGRNGQAELPGVRPGDRLLRVDGVVVTGASLAEVLKALAGRVGESKSLTFQRAGRSRVVSAQVLRHP